MKILCFLKLFIHKNKAGAEAYLHRLLLGIQKKYPECKINVVIPNSEETQEFNVDNIQIFETTENSEICLNYIDSCDLLITQLNYLEISTNYALKINKPVINIYHGFLEKQFDIFIKNDNILKLFNSQNVYKNYKKYLKYDITNYCIINPYIDYNKYNEHFNNIEDREYITFVNPLKNKGCDVVVELAKHYRNKKFLIVKGGYQKEYQDLKSFRNLSNCHIINNTDDMINNVYLKSKIVLMPSRYESYGMVSAEAQALGIPVICNEYAEGLKENNGKLNLYGKTYDKVNNKNIKSYIDKIDILDHKESYILWSDYVMNYRKKQCEKQVIQQEEFIDNIEDFIDFLKK